jgi:hypothetical protein
LVFNIFILNKYLNVNINSGLIEIKKATKIMSIKIALVQIKVCEKPL